MADGNRIDKWLWCVRLFKTRSKATDACRSNKVTIDGKPLKPSREVHPGDVINIQGAVVTKTVEVKALLKNRLGASLIDQYLIDLTPSEEYDKLKVMRALNHEYRERGIGRPTKKERRMIDLLKKSEF